MKILYFIIVLLIFVFSTLFSQSIVINEFMSSNKDNVKDEDGNFSDWIEIYNDSEDMINLSNYTLSDDIKNLSRWHFPDTTIKSKEFLLIFASGKNKRVPGRELHTNFSIKNEGEDLFLVNLGNIVHKVNATELKENESYGLYPDASNNFYKFHIPSPGKSNNLGSVHDEVIFSQNGGIYKNCFTLFLSSKNPDNQIYYTTDGSIPTTSSFLYKLPMLLDKSLFSDNDISLIRMSPDSYYYAPERIIKAIIIKAAVFNKGNKVSEVGTNTYFINELGNIHNDFPIISISAEKRDLFNDTVGIMVPGLLFNPNDPKWTGNYFSRGIEWERPAYIEFYEPNNKLAFKQNIGIRMHGGNCRAYSQKAFRIYARSEYGSNCFKYQIFKDKEIEEFKRLVFRPFYSSWTDAGIENYITYKIVKEFNFDWVATRPVIIYINGEYWGIYFIEERIDEYFLKSNYNANSNNVDIIEDWLGFVEEGDNIAYFLLYKFIETNDLSLQSNYDIVEKWMDIDNFIDYQIYEIFIANQDWPSNNMNCWRERKEGAKWRWIFFDGDAGLINSNFEGFKHAMSTSNDVWPTNAHSTLFFRKLLENSTFCNKFFQRMQILFNNELDYQNICKFYQGIFFHLKQEINKQKERFNKPNSFNSWINALDNINSFLISRSCIMKTQVLDMFSKELYVKSCNFTSIETKNSEFEVNQIFGKINIKYDTNENEQIQIFLVNILGQKQLLYNGFASEGENFISTDGFNVPNGFYVLSIQSNSKFLSEKIIIEN